MAGPITHVALALKILALLPNNIDKKEFIVGTSFPDIRYVGHLSRDSTHIEPVSWNDVINETSSFRAGMLFHNLVDILRINHFEFYFMDKWSLFNGSLVNKKLFPSIMKVSEDVLMYDNVQNWDEIINYFNSIYSEERRWCPDEKIIKKWHLCLQNYFHQKPSSKSIGALMSNFQINLGASELLSAEQLLNNFLTVSIFKQKLKEFYKNFIDILLASGSVTSKSKSYIK